MSTAVVDDTGWRRSSIINSIVGEGWGETDKPASVAAVVIQSDYIP